MVIKKQIDEGFLYHYKRFSNTWLNHKSIENKFIFIKYFISAIFKQQNRQFDCDSLYLL